jgi:hypothetical protein
MKFVETVLPRPAARQMLTERAPQPSPSGDGEVLCFESGADFLDVLFTFTALLLVFGIGLGFGLFVRGP